MTLASKRLESKITESDTCPFDKVMCGKGIVFQLDSGYINSDHHLGINAPSKDQAYYRFVTTWTPLAAQTHTSNWIWPADEPVLGEPYKFYSFGPTLVEGVVKRHYTFSYGNYSSMYYPLPYYLNCRSYYPLDPLHDLTISFFHPIPQLLRTEADVSILALSKYTTYLQQVTDTWFSATTKTDSKTLKLEGSTSLYPPDVPVSFLGVTTQVQFCHSPEFKTNCNPLQGVYQLRKAMNSSAYTFNFAAFNERQIATAHLLWSCTTFSSFSNAIAALSGNVLNAWSYTWGSTSHISGGLPSNQWQIEAANLHNLTLAGIQRMLVEWASTPVLELQNGNTSTDYINPPEKKEDALCGTIKMRNASYSGTLIILINICLADTVHALSKRKSSSNIFNLEKSLGWIHAESLHLQRQLLEERGVGPWKRGHEAVPVTKEFGQEFRVEDGREKDRQFILDRTSQGESPEQGDGGFHGGVPRPKYGYVSIPVDAV
ncbi:hypothetical protein BCR34DRAFT_599396 [Clohesyomyces aquaticus]|uniref:Uncharacterized protein n=1 Tax=Clohesyomyces aquaticus TaxID=1231657 RepID=A0A1Y1ZVE9_9PLEO|nr:hypothetical protein BCR34DRAFT_599396 [Clohesyomyces aquaticus]